MTKRELAGLAVRIIAVYALVQAINSFFMIWEVTQDNGGFLSYIDSPEPNLRTFFWGCVGRFVMTVLLFVFWRPIAIFLADESPLVGSHPFQNVAEVERMTFRAVGMWWFFQALSGFSLVTFNWWRYEFSAATGEYREWPRFLGAYSQTLLAMALFIPWRRVFAPKTWGRDPEMPTNLERPAGDERETENQSG